MKIYPFLFVLSLIGTHVAKGAVSLALSDTDGLPNSVTITPGGSFDITLTLNSTSEATAGISYLMEALGSGSSFFRITARDVAGSAYGDLATDDGIALSAANSLLAPTNNLHDLGGLVEPGNTGVGSFKVATFTIQALPGIAPGSYSIATNSAFALDANFDTIALNQPTYGVTVVPEPGSAAMLGLGIAGILFRRRK